MLIDGGVRSGLDTIAEWTLERVSLPKIKHGLILEYNKCFKSLQQDSIGFYFWEGQLLSLVVLLNL